MTQEKNTPQFGPDLSHLPIRSCSNCEDASLPEDPEEDLSSLMLARLNLVVNTLEISDNSDDDLLQEKAQTEEFFSNPGEPLSV